MSCMSLMFYISWLSKLWRRNFFLEKEIVFLSSLTKNNWFFYIIRSCCYFLATPHLMFYGGRAQWLCGREDISASLLEPISCRLFPCYRGFANELLLRYKERPSAFLLCNSNENLPLSDDGREKRVEPQFLYGKNKFAEGILYRSSVLLPGQKPVADPPLQWPAKWRLHHKNTLFLTGWGASWPQPQVFYVVNILFFSPWQPIHLYWIFLVFGHLQF